MARSRDRRPHSAGPSLRPVPESALTPEETAELAALVGEWLPLPDVAERTGLGIMTVRRLVAEGELAAVRVDGVQQVPAAFLLQTPEGTVPLPELRGTMTLLADARYSVAEAVRWLFTPDETLVEGRPVDTLRAGRKTEIRRRAQALGF